MKLKKEVLLPFVGDTRVVTRVAVTAFLTFAAAIAFVAFSTLGALTIYESGFDYGAWAFVVGMVVVCAPVALFHPGDGSLRSRFIFARMRPHE